VEVLLLVFKVYVDGLANVHVLLTLPCVCMCMHTHTHACEHVYLCACVHTQMVLCCSVPEIMAFHILCVLTGPEE